MLNLGRIFRPRGHVQTMRTHPMGYAPEWEKKELPGYGNAPQYAYDVLSLAPQNLSNGYAVGMATQVFGPPQIEHVQQTRVDGLGIQAGTLVLPVLFDPSANLGSAK